MKVFTLVMPQEDAMAFIHTRSDEVGDLIAKQLSEQLDAFQPGDRVEYKTAKNPHETRIVLKVSGELVHYVVLGHLGVHSAYARELVKVG